MNKLPLSTRTSRDTSRANPTLFHSLLKAALRLGDYAANSNIVSFDPKEALSQISIFTMLRDDVQISRSLVRVRGDGTAEFVEFV